MADTRLPNRLFFGIVAAALAQCIHDFTLLPDRMATHFAASGAPNGWMTKPQFFIAYALLTLPAAAAGFWVPRTIAKTPNVRLNLPNKEYWLASERRGETIGYFEKFFAWYGCAFLSVEVFAMGLAIHANFSTPPKLPTGPIVLLLVAFVVFNALAVIATFRRFAMPR